MHFQENVKGKDQNIRKLEQELDSLTFRNKQLASRVEVLQQELDAGAAAKGKKTKVKHRLHCYLVTRNSIYVLQMDGCTLVSYKHALNNQLNFRSFLHNPCRHEPCGQD